MCGGLLIGLIGAVVLAKIARTAFRWRYGYGGGGCGYHGRACGYGGYGGHGGPGGYVGGRGWRGFGGHHGFGGYGGYGGWGGWGGYREGGEDEGGERGEGGPGKRFFLRFLFERLETTPGQEKVILEAFDEIKDAMKKAKGEWRSSFADFAKAIRGAEFDHGAVSEAFVRHDGLFEQARMAVITALQKVHEALDDKQRTKLADLIEAGPKGFGGFRGGRPEWV